LVSGGKSEAVAYLLYYRTGEGRRRWYTIGRHGAPWPPDATRDEATRLLGDVAQKLDPAAEKGQQRQNGSRIVGSARS
jgi:hypothetical protein